MEADMGENHDTATPVYQTLWKLREALHVSQMRENGGLKGDPREIATVWDELNSSLLAAMPSLQQPEEGHGLDVLWLISVYKAVQWLNDRLNARSWPEILFQDDNTVFHLVLTDCERSYQVAKRYRSQRRTLPDLEGAATSALDELRKLSTDWDEARRRRLNEAKEEGVPVPFSWYVDTTPARRAGELLLSAVDRVEIPLGGLDEDFRERLLKNLETPSGIVWGHMTGAADESLGDLLSRLAPPPAIDPSDSARRYPTPESYERDMWIYDNIATYTCRTLSAEMKVRGRGRGWRFISSRNSIKEAADRYADFHNLPQRRFPPPQGY
jgi:hypothetical protein